MDLDTKRRKKKSCRLLSTKRTLQTNSWSIKDRAGKDSNAATILRRAPAAALSRKRSFACVTRIATFTLTKKKKKAQYVTLSLLQCWLLYISCHTVHHTHALYFSASATNVFQSSSNKNKAFLQNTQTVNSSLGYIMYKSDLESLFGFR